MIISEQKKYIYIHIPKSAGHSFFNLLTNDKNMLNIEKRWNVNLNKILGAHKSAGYFKEKFKERYDNYFKFAFVRNPFDRMVSVYHYVKQIDHRDSWIDSFPDFTSFVNGIVYGGVKGFPHRKELSFYICDEKGNLMVDFVGKIENLDKDFKRLGKNIEIRGKLPYENVSKHKAYREYYTDKTKKLIEQQFKMDLKIFDYEF